MLTPKTWKIAISFKLKIVLRKLQTNYQKEKMPTKYIKLKKVEIVECEVDGHT